MKTYRPDVPDMATTPVIFCADDFGLNRPVNDGILALARQGRLSATSCMTKGATFASDAPALAELTIGKGLHLNLTEAQTGTRIALPLRELIRRCYLHNIDVAQLRADIEAQCDAFEQAFGAAPDYVDGHQHVHQLPVVREELLPILQRRYGSRKPWLRSTRAPRSIITLRRAQARKALTVRAMGAGFSRAAKAQGFHLNDGFAGFSSFRSDKDYARAFESYLRAPGRRHLVMCHPGYVDEDLKALDPVTTTREQELAFLLSPRLPDMLEQHRMRLARMSTMEG